MTEMSREEATTTLSQVHVSRLDQVVAITTPIPDQRGHTSKKTPIFHLPVYQIKLEMRGDVSSTDGELQFHCDLADLTDLIDKLKSYQNQWRLLGNLSTTRATK